MKQFVKILQHPILKIALSPFAIVIFGLIASSTSGGKFSLIDCTLLYLITVSGHLLSHYFFLKYSLNSTENHNSMLILLVCEVVLLGASCLYLLNHHWLINTLLIIYVAYLHLEYFPYNLSSTWFHYMLEIFFNAFVLNCIAFFTFANTLSTTFVQALIPLLLLQAALQVQALPLRNALMGLTRPSFFSSATTLSLGIAAISLFLALLSSRPSHSFFIVQILFTIIAILLFIPLSVQTNRQKQNQRKLNYLSALYFVFACCYGLAYIF